MVEGRSSEQLSEARAFAGLFHERARRRSRSHDRRADATAAPDSTPVRVLTATSDQPLQRSVKILYAVTQSRIGGAQVHVLDLLRGFSNRHDLVLAVGEDGYLADEARQLGVRVHLLPDLVHPIHPVKDARAFNSLYRLIQDEAPDLVHAHTSKAGVLGRMAARAVGVPAVFTSHGWQFSTGTPWSRRLVAIPIEWVGGRWCTRIITLCDFDRTIARRFHIAPSGRLSVINGAVSDVSERADPGKSDPPTIIMTARFAAQKAQGQLVRAVADIPDPFRLWFVGDGPTLGVVRAEVARLGLETKVEFLGARTDVPALLAEASLFVLSTNWEGLGLSILEASRAGLPAVATNVGGVSEALCDGETGFLVPPGDEAALRDRIVTLLRNPELRRQMGKAARRHYEGKFTPAQQLSRTEAVYRAAIAAH